MTIVLTGIAPELIVITTDTCVTNDFEDGHREYTTEQKLFRFQGVGCVATWGTREGNKIGDFLAREHIDARCHSIEDLEALVWKYLSEEYQPRENNLGAVGYHVVGFDRDARPRLFEILWGPKSRTKTTDAPWSYQHYDNSPGSRALRFSYSGRFDLIHKMITTLIDLYNEEIDTGDLRYSYLNHPSGLVQFADLVARFTGELTREIEPPFVSYLLSPGNKIQQVVNRSFQPINEDLIKQKIGELGISAA